MRVLLVNKFAHVTGGADRYCLELASALRARGHEVRFLATASEEDREEGAFVPATVTHETRDAASGGDRLRIAANAVWNRQAAAATRALVRDFQPQVAHAHKLYPQLSVAPVVALRDAGVPLIQTLHDYDFISAGYTDHRGRVVDMTETKAAYRALNSATLAIRRLVHARRVDRWVAVSRALAGIYAAHGLHATVLPNFVDARAAPEPATYEQREGILFLGRLTPIKGVELVFELARCLPSIPVRIAGGGELEGRVRAAADALPNLSYVGQLPSERTLEVLGRARLALLPSLWEEPGPLSCLEAMAVGTPVVCSRVGGLAEYVEDAAAGSAVESTVDALASACASLYRDPGRWQELSAAGAHAARTVHSPERHVDSVLLEYEAAIRGSPGPVRAEA